MEVKEGSRIKRGWGRLAVKKGILVGTQRKPGISVGRLEEEEHPRHGGQPEKMPERWRRAPAKIISSLSTGHNLLCSS